MNIDTDKLAGIVLASGSHKAPPPGTPIAECEACLLEVVPLILHARQDGAGVWRWQGASADWTDSPDSVSPYLASFGRTLNDRLDALFERLIRCDAA